MSVKRHSSSRVVGTASALARSSAALRRALSHASGLCGG
jgi:hypothetical protein